MKGLRLLLVLTSIGTASAASAETFCIIPCFLTPCSQHTWPTDPPPCDNTSTLQACVDSAGSGDTVLIAFNSVNQSISFQKTLTLAAAQGFTPVFSTGRSITAEATTGCNSFTIQGLTLQQGEILVAQESGGSLNARILGNTIQSPSTAQGAIMMQVGESVGPVGFEVSGNTISIPYDETGVLEHESAIVIYGDGPSFTGVVEDNSIAMEGIVGGAAIDVTNRADSAQVDVIANRITGEDYDNGVIFNQAAGALQGRALDNLVIGAAGPTSGTKGGVSVETTGGTFDGTIANNTIATADRGIYVYGSSASGLVANNIVGCSQSGIYIDQASPPTVENFDNLLFGSGCQKFYGTTAGLGTLSTDPLFVGPDDYHLQPGSPAIDGGTNRPIPTTDVEGNPITDLDGHPRIQGLRVDIGAYEAPEPDAQMLALAALSALAGLASLRRRRALR